MNDHLFKLKRKGTVTGYKKIVNGLIFIKSTTTNVWGCLTQQTNFGDFVEYRFAIDEYVSDELYVDSEFSFVTKDKDGKDVSAGDFCRIGDPFGGIGSTVEGYVRWTDAELTWRIEWNDRRGDTISMLVSAITDIELIEDEDDD